MQYIVKTRYEDFVFDNASTATNVAVMLVEHSTEDLCVEIVVKKDKIESEKQKDNLKNYSLGEWEWENDKPICSVCGEKALSNGNNDYYFSKYCPNCGSFMYEEE